MIRQNKDEYYLDIAKSVSNRSTCIRAHCGAIIVNNDTIISTGYNGNPRNTSNCVDVGKCPRADYKPQEGTHLCNAVHAEMNCFINLARNGGSSCKGGTLYVWFKREDSSYNSYNKPCNNCMKHIMNSGLVRIVNITIDKYSCHLDISTIENGNIITVRIY